MKSHLNSLERIIEPGEAHLSPVKEATIYPTQTADYLHNKMQGKTVEEAAKALGIKVPELVQILDRRWRPSKLVCERLGLKVVYALPTEPQHPESHANASAPTGLHGIPA